MLGVIATLVAIGLMIVLFMGHQWVLGGIALILGLMAAAATAQRFRTHGVDT